MTQDSISLTVDLREVTGKAVKHLRREGLVPAVIHDHGRQSVHVMGKYLDIVKVYREAGRHHTIELIAGDKNFTTLIKKIDLDPKKHQIRHVVFNAVDKDQKVEAEVPIRPRYDGENESSPAERAGLIVLTQLDMVEVKALPSQIPDELTYDAEKLIEVGDHATVADLKLPTGVEILTDSEHPLATVYEPSAVAAANDEAAGDAQPEDASEVESEEGSAETDDQTSGKDEIRPGGKEQKESHEQGTNPEKH